MGFRNLRFVLFACCFWPGTLCLAQHGGGSHPAGIGVGAGVGSNIRPGGTGLSATVPYRPPASAGVGHAPLFGTFPNLNTSYGNAPAVPSYPGTAPRRGPWRQANTSGHSRRSRSYGYVGVPFFGYGAYPYLDDSDSDAYAPGPYSNDPGPEPGDEAALNDQLQQLSAQVNDLRNSLPQAAPAALPPATPPESVPPAPPVTIVLKSGQTWQVQSYAVMGNTFWDFSSQPVRKVPVSTIDIPASSKATEAGGAEFPAIHSPS